MEQFKRKLRFFLLFSQSFLKRYYWYILLGLCLGGIIFQASFKMPVFVKKNLSGKIGYVGNFTESTLPSEIEKKISRGFFYLDSKYALKKDLVEDYKIKDKGKTYWFKLKKGIFWQDGTKFKAKDVYYNFKDVEKKVLGDYELEYRLKEPYGPFLELLTRPLFKTKRLIGLGKYKMVGIEKSGNFINELSIERVEGKKLKETGFERIRYRFYPSEEALVSGFKLGEVDEARGLTSKYDLEHWPNLEIEKEVNYDYWVGVFFNFRSSMMAEKSIRQALFYGIESFKIEEPKVYSPIGINSWAYTKNVKNYSYSPADSERLLEKLDEGARRKIKIDLVAVRPYDKYLEDIALSWERLGLKVKAYRSSVIPQRFDCLVTAFKIPKDPDQYYFWQSDQKGNFINFNSAKIDKALEEGRLEYKVEKRKGIYHDFQKYFMEELPAAPLYYPVSYNIIRK